jgi:MFS family permease
MDSVAEKSPFAIPNIRFFVALRIFFNTRFYYPVFTILFLDFGLSIEQFALLNTVWAATIVLAEVPSGALADIIGRKRLLVATSVLMILEMTLICFVPLGNISLIFWVFLVNRVLSGLAEAMASGADEALAYDTLVERGMADEWSRVLDIQMRMQSAGFVVTMTIGALVYDPAIVNRVLEWVGSSATVTQQVSMRFPLYLTLGLGFMALMATLSMTEPLVDGQDRSRSGSTGEMIGRALRLTWQAGCWIFRTPFALAVILFGMTFDHTLRMLVTMTSQYYRLISLPEASFGLIGSAIGILGLVIPRIARSMTRHWTPSRNLAVLAVISLAGLWGLIGFYPYVGLLPMVLVFVGLMLTSFFTSHYLNRITSSGHRATVLSFKGLSFNLAYGMIGLLYAGLMRHLRAEQGEMHPSWTAQAVENQAFRESISWFPWYTLVIFAFVLLFCLRIRRYLAARKECG